MNGALGWFTGTITTAIEAAGSVFREREVQRTADAAARREAELAGLAEKERSERTRLIVFAAVGVAALAAIVVSNRRRSR